MKRAILQLEVNHRAGSDPDHPSQETFPCKRLFNTDLAQCLDDPQTKRRGLGSLRQKPMTIGVRQRPRG
jgi:hypothetical protein